MRKEIMQVLDWNHIQYSIKDYYTTFGELGDTLYIDTLSERIHFDVLSEISQICNKHGYGLDDVEIRDGFITIWIHKL